MIMMRCQGGLGNQLFQYAAGRSRAEAAGTRLKLDGSWYLIPVHQRKVTRTFDLPYFRIAADLAEPHDLAHFGLGAASPWRRAMAALGRRWHRRKYYTFSGTGYDETFERLGQEVILEGYFQHPRFFAGIAAQLRRELQLRETPPARIAELARTLRDHASVCVQVRRDDFLLAENAAVHGVCSVDYYVRAWAHILTHVPDARPWVFTDDVAWATEQLGFLNPAGMVGDDLAGPAYLQKFQLMRSCRHFITANSTFGWWAAWLGAEPSSQVVLPRAWYGSADVDAVGLRLPGWHAC